VQAADERGVVGEHHDLGNPLGTGSGADRSNDRFDLHPLPPRASVAVGAATAANWASIAPHTFASLTGSISR
jgi:hypothetical protein